MGCCGSCQPSFKGGGHTRLVIGPPKNGKILRHFFKLKCVCAILFCGRRTSHRIRILQIVQCWTIPNYCGWKKSCTTLDGWNPINNGINHLSTGAGFLPSTGKVIIFNVTWYAWNNFLNQHRTGGILTMFKCLVLLHEYYPQPWEYFNIVSI